MPWTRLGKLIAPDGSYNYQAKPILIPRGDKYDVILTDRDNNNCSYIKKATFSLEDRVVSRGETVYQKDNTAQLEANGVMAMASYTSPESLYIFCTSFYFDSERNFLSNPVLINLDRKTYELKEKSNIVIGDKNIPTGCGGLIEKDGIVYLIFESRIAKDRYFSFELKMASSKDFINWTIEDKFSIRPGNDEDYISSPSLMTYGNKYLMSYSSKKSGRYSILFKESDDLINWTSKPEMTFSPSDNHDWENLETCYPFIFQDHHNQICMLYNGNKYGKTGAGLARWN